MDAVTILDIPDSSPIRNGQFFMMSVLAEGQCLAHPVD
jgi:hypothetical protein